MLKGLSYEAIEHLIFNNILEASMVKANVYPALIDVLDSLIGLHSSYKFLREFIDRKSENIDKRVSKKNNLLLLLHLINILLY